MTSRTFLPLLLCLIAWLPAARGQQRAVLVDRIVAIVNKDVITSSELAEAVGSAERNLRRRGTQLPPRELLEKQMLERLVLDKAQLQMARETGIRVDELQLDRAIQRVAEQNRMTLAEFRAALERDKVPFAAYREDLREQIILSRLREREVNDKIQVSDGEIELFLAETKAERVEFNLAHILVRIPEQASPERVEAARGRADKVVSEARGGGDFGRLAASYSDAPDALQGGVIGWRAQDRLPDLFVAALDKMKPGDVSEVLRSPAGFHVVKLLERRGAGGAADSGAPVQQTRLRHILIRTGDSVSDADARRRLLTLRERIVGGGADFAEMARVHSDDGSAARGGELDWIYPGDTVPDFERAYLELKIGEVSEPVRTPFGYHLIQVLERRSADVSVERRKMQARLALRERKADNAYQEWLRQLRDQSYVELRLEER
jgi:peptidyl-prolyl cis-trans isomerase SurA